MKRERDRDKMGQREEVKRERDNMGQREEVKREREIRWDRWKR